MTTHGLGRLAAEDPRDRGYPLRAFLAVPVVRKTTTWTMRYGALDQGQTSCCVGFGMKHLLMLGPVKQTSPTSRPTAFDVYDAAIKVDEWPENDVDPGRQAGTSVRAGFKALQGYGLLDTYAWARTAEDVIDWLCSSGPCLVGSDWLSGMFEPDAEGIVRVNESDAVAGGHCWTLCGWDQRRGLLRALNSWGKNWSINGRFWLTPEDFEKLLDRGGEAGTAVDHRKRAA